ncbi:hypothetical protein FHU29_001397 [Hoyosella altamirensis]|uniref:Uncharacterized protein n=1 Tax=Hoyosella altamirensis TaxID=616997 RepID=A0A839RLN8_9ACTN|nr:hypothetical protein [Hoyosella altamirensis]
MCRSNSRPAPRVDPAGVPFGNYRASRNGGLIVVAGPRKVYPSGIPYYEIVGQPGAYVPAAHLDWVERISTTNCRVSGEGAA